MNSDPRSPSLQELHAHVRAAYHQGLLGMESGRLFRTEHLEGIADRMATARAASVQALVNSRLRSPTVEEIIDTLRPPQRPRRPMVEYVPSADDDESEISESGHVPRSAAPLR